MGFREVVHIVGWWQHLLDRLGWKVPRALCGQLQLADPDRANSVTEAASQLEDGDAVMCPRCVERAGWPLGRDALCWDVDWDAAITRVRLLDTCPATPEVLLRGAAELIERDGWEQGTYWAGAGIGVEEPYRPGRPCCPLGALAVTAGVCQVRDVDWAMESLPGLVRAVEALQGLLAPEGPTAATWAVWTWNDANGRTAAEVVAALRRAADQLTPGSGGSSAKTSDQAGSPNHQNDSKQTGAPRTVRREGSVER